ncbi:hypothetical protein VHEMI03074 [[Torrubiella] hemipterigena]|uniref:GrpB domain protein n=1 Tax=[Torrubiella] hemipterigena TaxID=1531966 RepID=A0A0A1T9T3_9HYPO|nr:hypothetical protein VHEMI03074 [[Torrubiella] hemipterigena]
MGEIIVVDYDPTWPALFTQLTTPVKEALGSLSTRIEHVGSTSVPGLAAKPIIDMDIVIPSWDVLPLVIAKLAELGYDHEGIKGIPEREAFERPKGAHRHHLYVCADETREVKRHVAFRDALRGNDTLRDEYAALKKRLAEQYKTDVDAYCDAKTDFIEGVLRSTT